ncbi:hypothetical protein HYX09_05725 [Candidatus Woesearchaeota archaeon]|nr:hypothetical protein [Candidatus Woesearchaeota archaeon]
MGFDICWEQQTLNDEVAPRGVAFINYDCTPIKRVIKGIKECKGRYYIFANKVNGRWIADEDSKQIIW